MSLILSSVQDDVDQQALYPAGGNKYQRGTVLLEENWVKLGKGDDENTLKPNSFTPKAVVLMIFTLVFLKEC